MSITFLGCKKGEDDPFLSLRSRKARITGEWILESRDYSTHSKYTQSENSSHYVYANGIEILSFSTTENGVTTQSADTVSYTETYKFEKDGSYSLIKNDGQNTPVTVKGNWTFLKKNKENNLENKEAILLTNTYSTFNNSQQTYSNETITGQSYQIIELRNKKIVLYYESSLSSTNNASNESSISEASTKLVLSRK